MKGGFESRLLSCVQKVGNALQHEFVVVVVLCTRVTRVGMVKPNGLKAGQGVCEYAYPVVGRGCGKGSVNGYQFRPHDSAGLFLSCNIYVDSGAGGNAYHCRP